MGGLQGCRVRRRDSFPHPSLAFPGGQIASATTGPFPASSMDAAFQPWGRCGENPLGPQGAPPAPCPTVPGYHLCCCSADGQRGTERRRARKDSRDGGHGKMEPMPFPKLGQAEGRAMPVCIASTCAGEQRSRRRAGATSSQTGQLCPRSPCTSSHASQLLTPKLLCTPWALHLSPPWASTPTAPRVYFWVRSTRGSLWRQKKKAPFSRSMQKAKFLPRNIP